MEAPFRREMVGGPPALMEEGGFDSIREGHEGFEARLKVKEDQFGIEFQAEGVTEGRLNGETTKVVGGATQAPEFNGFGPCRRSSSV
ncbi:MAG TPA: hypothetical protein VF219_11125, partial [Vicinamibacterales bacterium]